MPGRWVGGKGSIASPVKDSFIEGEVFGERGQKQGTVIIKIKRTHAPGALGRLVTLSVPRTGRTESGRTQEKEGSLQ